MSITEIRNVSASASLDISNPADVEDLIPPDSSRSRLWIIRICSIVFTFGAWEILGRQVDPLFMSYPTAIAHAGVRLVQNGELFTALQSSLRSLVVSFGFAVVIGLALGLLIGRYRSVEAATDWIVNALYATPKVAILPLVILWFGLGDTAKIFIVSLLAVFPILINTISGVRNVPAQLIDVGNAFAAREDQIFRKIILPSAMPYMMTGIRLGIGRAIIGLVVAEFFTAMTGLGALIVKYGNQYDTASMFVPIILLSFIGVVTSSLVKWVEQRLAPWRYTEE
ncbi:ABC transporter permease [Aminobacter sp. AP02]|uniref:ABC transporter permease n=1 Tax=Aminobacter sp. AP02 TaxID=2135737 RepID=UPI000D6D5544|nr:ABC transporter permease [Aminobacter sp. AP02]PWK61303.1 NitT/TauT family transport system permease protein [Aminobacter sp. AP02]